MITMSVTMILIGILLMAVFLDSDGGCIVFILGVILLIYGMATFDAQNRKQCVGMAKFSINDMVHVIGFDRPIKITDVRCYSSSNIQYVTINETGTTVVVTEKELEK